MRITATMRRGMQEGSDEKGRRRMVGRKIREQRTIINFDDGDNDDGDSGDDGGVHNVKKIGME